MSPEEDKKAVELVQKYHPSATDRKRLTNTPVRAIASVLKLCG
jgi:hypothetical protein